LANFFTRTSFAKIRAEAAAAQPFTSAVADEISIRMQPFLELQLACETKMNLKKQTRRTQHESKTQSKRAQHNTQWLFSRDTEAERMPPSNTSSVTLQHLVPQIKQRPIYSQS
jgi:hypothetical protein